MEIIEKSAHIIRKEDREELKSFLKEVSNEFTKPSSIEKNAYLFSAAFTNYIFSITDVTGGKN